MRYYKETKQEWEDNKDTFLKLIKRKEKPYKIEFKFVRGSKRKFDYINILQVVQDQMVKYGWLEDDNMTEMLPSFAPYEYNKEAPGVHIKVL